jgi:hypothetical protein
MNYGALVMWSSRVDALSVAENHCGKKYRVPDLGTGYTGMGWNDSVINPFRGHI